MSWLPRRLLIAPAALLAVFASGARALEVPPLTGRVVDLANVLPPDRAKALTEKLAAFEASDSTQIAVLTIPSLEGESVEGYSIRVAEKWALGQKGRDNGALLLISVQDHDIRIEVGRGLEGSLPDITAGRIIRNEIAPHFKDGDFAGGVDAGVDAMIQAVRGEYQATGQPTGSLRHEGPGTGLLILAVVSIIVSAIGAMAKRLIGGGIAAVAWIIGGFLFLGAASWLLIILLLPVLFGAGMISPELCRIGLSIAFSGGGGGRGGGGGFSGGGGSFGGGGASGKW